jgi:hypothetical protein
MKRLGLYTVAATLFAPSAFAAQCYELRFLDAKGVLVPVNPPLVGMVIGEGLPLFEGTPPAHEQIESGRMLPCPDALLASARKAFDDFCTSDDRRKKAAAANSVDMSVINTRCADLTAALAK